jgi:hypothetical protein
MLEGSVVCTGCAHCPLHVVNDARVHYACRTDYQTPLNGSRQTAIGMAD